MSDGTNIQVKITASGGDAAAAEIKKLDKAQAALAATTSTVTKQAVSMKTDWKNVGYQVQDVAVQVGAGTSAFRALGQQLPQLLSGFGPMGVLLGTVSAVALPLAGAMFNLGNGTKEAGDKADAATDKLKKLGDARLEKQIAASAKDFKAYLDGLDDEFQKLNRNNDAVQRSINLIQAEQRAKVGVQNAQAALDLAEIDASDMPEADKIQARAKVQRRVERERFDNEKTQAGFRVNAAFNKAAGATQEAGSKAGEADDVRQKLAAQEAEAATLTGKINAADQAKESLKAADSRVAKAKAERDALTSRVSPETGEALFTPAQLAAKDADLNARQTERDKIALAAGGASQADRDRLDVLAGKKNDAGVRSGGDIEKSKAAVESLANAAKDLEAVAAKLREEYTNVRAVETTELGGKFQESKLRLQGITTQAAGGTRAAVRKTAADVIADQQKAARDAAGQDIATRQDALDAGARTQGLGLRGKPNATAQDVGKALSDGTNADELQKLGDQVRDAAGKNGAAVTAFLLQIIDSFNTQAKDIETLKRRFNQ